MLTLPIYNHLKPSVTGRRWNKAKYLTWNTWRLNSVKKTSMTNPVKSLGYIKCHSSCSPRPVAESSSHSIRCNCQKICSWLRRPKTILKIVEKTTFLISQWPLMRPSNNLENETLSDTYWKVQLICMKGNAHSSLEPLECNQDQMILP